MSRTIPAIFDAGVFRPLEPVGLADGTQVELQLQLPDGSSGSPSGENSKKAWLEYLERMESLPDKSAPDGLSNRDHDRIIYGG
jgi:predicted DNA-binding antitoxin AbrB/MazE fold protein